MNANNYQLKNNKLRELCKYNTGKTPAKEWYANKGTTKIIKFRDIKEDGSICYTNDEDGWVKEEYSEYNKLVDIEEEMILLTSSAHSSEHIGKKVTLVKEIPKAAKRYCYVGEITGIKSNSEDILIDWIFYYLQSSKGLAEIVKMVEGMHLTPRPLGQINVLYPPKEVQLHLLLYVQSLDEVIAKTKEKTVAIQRLKQSVLKQLFTQGIPGKHKKFKSTKIGKIPEEWEVLRIQDILASPLVNGVSPQSRPEPPGTPVLNVSCIKDGICNTSLVTYVDLDEATFNKYQAKKGDFYVLRGNGNRDYIARGGLLTIEPDPPCIFSDLLIRLRFNPDFVVDKFIPWMWQSEIFKYRLQSKAKSGNGLWKIGLRDIRRELIACPKPDEQIEIVHILNSIQTLVESLQAELASLQRLKRSLLQNLLTGKVRVNLDGVV
jgi:type I restriction enzyme S subunit